MRARVAGPGLQQPCTTIDSQLRRREPASILLGLLLAVLTPGMLIELNAGSTSPVRARSQTHEPHPAKGSRSLPWSPQK
jgi:hypothetical protein